MKKSNLKSFNNSNDESTDYAGGGKGSLSPLKVNHKVRVADGAPMSIKQLRSKQFMIDLNSNVDENEQWTNRDQAIKPMRHALTPARRTRFGEMSNRFESPSAVRGLKPLPPLSHTPEQQAALQRRRNTILMLQNKEVLKLRSTLKEKIKKLHRKKEVAKLMTKTN